MKEIPLTQGMVALVDDEDYDTLIQWKWQVARRYKTIYAQSHPAPGIWVLMHRVVTHAAKGLEVDHINHNGLDNRKENLRVVTRQQNSFNMSKERIRGKSHYKGVTFFEGNAKNRPWMAQITISGKNKTLGYFATEEEAARAYDAASLKYHGEFGRRNFEDA